MIIVDDSAPGKLLESMNNYQKQVEILNFYIMTKDPREKKNIHKSSMTHHHGQTPPAVKGNQIISELLTNYSESEKVEV